MKIVCLDAATLGSDVNLDVFEQFGEFVSFETTAEAERIERLKGADVVITNKVVIDKETMDASNLKLICISATGMNNVDLAYAAAKGIAVKNVAGYSTGATFGIAGITYAKDSCTLGRSHLHACVVIGQIDTIIVWRRRLRFVREPRGLFVRKELLAPFSQSYGVVR